MHHENITVKSKAAKCLMMITSAKTGKVMAYDDNTLKKLYVLLCDEVYRTIFFCGCSDKIFGN